MTSDCFQTTIKLCKPVEKVESYIQIINSDNAKEKVYCPKNNLTVKQMQMRSKVTLKPAKTGISR